jgi:hypothetical protein
MYLAAQLNALGGGDLGLAMASLRHGAVGGLGQSTEDDLINLAQEAQMDPAILLKAYRDEQAALRAAVDRASYIRDRLRQMKVDYAKAEDAVAGARAWVGQNPTPEAERNLALAEKRLSVVNFLFKKVEEESQGGGMGIWPAAVILALAAIPAIIVATYQLSRGDIGGSINKAVTVVTISAAFLGLLWFAKVAKDIWNPPKGT